MNITVKLPHFGAEVAPVGDPDASIEEGKYPQSFDPGDFE
jgi:hypothetical protein